MSRTTTIESLRRLVQMGEGAALEFKRRVPAPERVAKEIVAFANTSGGTVLLGVADNGTITGLKDAIEETFVLEQALERHCRPAVALELERVPISRKREVIVVRVPNSPDKPHYVELEDGSRTAYVRVRDESVEASREAVRLMKHERAEPAGVRFEFGEKELLLMRYLDQYGRITVDQFARLADIPRRRASHTLVLLTRAEVLRFQAGDRADYFTPSAERGKTGS